MSGLCSSTVILNVLSWKGNNDGIAMQMADSAECAGTTFADSASLLELPEGQLPSADGGSGDCAAVDDPFLCQICRKQFQQPRVLNCLHVFCSGCLDRLLEDKEGVGDGDAAAEMGVESSSKVALARSELEQVCLVCPTCKQATQVGGVLELPLDVVMMNAMDMFDINASRILCTSCKAEEKAVARCSDCANFLCSNCVTAHKYMRCFENHKVRL